MYDSEIVATSFGSFGSTTNVIAGPNTFGLEAWFKTTTTAGGKIIGFGNNSTGTSTNYDRHVYMEPDGRITFGVYPGSSQTISSSLSYNDGAWHQVAAGLSSDGMVLYVVFRLVLGQELASSLSVAQHWLICGAFTPALLLISHYCFRFIESPLQHKTAEVIGIVQKLVRAPIKIQQN